MRYTPVINQSGDTEVMVRKNNSVWFTSLAGCSIEHYWNDTPEAFSKLYPGVVFSDKADIYGMMEKCVSDYITLDE